MSTMVKIRVCWCRLHWVALPALLLFMICPFPMVCVTISAYHNMSLNAKLLDILTPMLLPSTSWMLNKYHLTCSFHNSGGSPSGKWIVQVPCRSSGLGWNWTHIWNLGPCTAHPTWMPLLYSGLGILQSPLWLALLSSQERNAPPTTWFPEQHTHCKYFVSSLHACEPALQPLWSCKDLEGKSLLWQD